MSNNITFLARRDIAEEWTTKNPLLIAGEIALDTTKGRIKLGDGTNTWNDLPYVKPDVIDDLTTGGQNDALSAEQGVELKRLIDNLRTDMENSSFEGAAGEAATIEIGEVETVANSAEASVENVGTSTNAILNFKIPKGAKGATGSAGITPNIQVISLVDICDDPGQARVERQGSITQPVLKFTLPRGEKGEDGDGKAATIEISKVTTGEPGTNASVVNKGTENAAKLEFTIPRGTNGVTPTIQAGTTTTGAAGTNAKVTASTSGTTTTFNFTIPKGDKGDGTDIVDSLAPATASATKALSSYQGYFLDYWKVRFVEDIDEESWTFTLSDGSTVSKKVACWTPTGSGRLATRRT